MDLNEIANRPVRNDSSSSVPGGMGIRTENQTLETLGADAISTVQNDWRNKVRNMDLESHSVEDHLTINQMKQDQLVNIQNELLDYPEKDFASISARVNSLVDGAEFQGHKILSEFRIVDSTSIYDYMARIEVEKNSIGDEIKANTQDLKARMISKQNLVAGDALNGKLDPKVIDEVKEYISSLNKSITLDNSYIKKLLA